jgi:predicted acetyltransferase
MDDDMPDLALVAPDVALHTSWLDAAAEFAAAGTFQHGSGLTPDGEEPRFGGQPWRPAELVDPERFAQFVAHLRGLADPDEERPGRPAGLVPDTKLWITQERTYLGAVSLRHRLNEHLLVEGGHIGYSVRPSAWGRGIASWALAATLEQARSMGIERTLLTCEETNPASVRVIERCGGVLENVRGTMRRYWIDLT